MSQFWAHLWMLVLKKLQWSIRCCYLSWNVNHTNQCIIHEPHVFWMKAYHDTLEVCLYSKNYPIVMIWQTGFDTSIHLSLIKQRWRYIITWLDKKTIHWRLLSPRSNIISFLFSTFWEKQIINWWHYKVILVTDLQDTNLQINKNLKQSKMHKNKNYKKNFNTGTSGVIF